MRARELPIRLSKADRHEVEKQRSRSPSPVAFQRRKSPPPSPTPFARGQKENATQEHDDQIAFVNQVQDALFAALDTGMAVVRLWSPQLLAARAALEGVDPYVQPLLLPDSTVRGVVIRLFVCRSV